MKKTKACIYIFLIAIIQVILIGETEIDFSSNAFVNLLKLKAPILFSQQLPLAPNLINETNFFRVSLTEEPAFPADLKSTNIILPLLGSSEKPFNPKNFIIFLILFDLFLIFKALLFFNKNFALESNLHERKKSIVTSGILIGFALACAYHYVLGFYLNLPVPHNSFLLDGTFRFTDFFDISLISKDFNPYDRLIGWGNYLPFAYLITFPFSILPRNLSLLLYVSTNLLIMTVFVKKFNLEFSPKEFFIFAFLTYPFLFNLDRGNLEIWLFAFTALFAYFYFNKQYLKSVIPLSLAICFKGYPVLFALLYLKQKKYKEFFLCGIFSFFSLVFFFSVFRGGFFNNTLGWYNSLAYYSRVMALNGDGWGFNSSIFGFLKAVDLLYRTDLISLASPIKYLSLVVILAVFFKTKSNNFRDFFQLVLLFVLIPQISADYRLLHCLIPLAFYLLDKSRSQFDFLYLTLFILIFVPKNYFYFYERISLSTLITPVSLIFIFTLITIESVISNKNNFPNSPEVTNVI